MAKENLVVIGSAGHAKVIIDIVEKSNKYQILGLIGLSHEIGQTLLSYEVLGTEEIIPSIMQAHPNCLFIIALGDNWKRSMVFHKVKAIYPDAEFATAIHPSAEIAQSASIGKGVVVMAGAIINSSTVIGDFSIVNTKSSVDHDNIFEEFTSIGPGATTGGNVTVQAFSAICMGAVIKHGLTIATQSVIGAGALLLNNCPSYTISYGSPAKVIRNRIAGENYL